jgi:hypothetical protein
LSSGGGGGGGGPYRAGMLLNGRTGRGCDCVRRMGALIARRLCIIILSRRLLMVMMTGSGVHAGTTCEWWSMWDCDID